MDSAVGLAILLASLACLGTWPALLDLSSLHGRHPSHAYLDYSTSILVVVSVLALASQEPLLETSWESIALAGGGGCLLMAGNLSMQRSLLLGVPLSIVLPLQHIVDAGAEDDAQAALQRKHDAERHAEED